MAQGAEEGVSLEQKGPRSWFCKVSLGNGKRFFFSVTGQVSERDPAGRGQAEQGWWQWDVQPAGWDGEDGLRGFSSPFAVCSGLFTY